MHLRFAIQGLLILRGSLTSSVTAFSQSLRYIGQATRPSSIQSFTFVSSSPRSTRRSRSPLQSRTMSSSGKSGDISPSGLLFGKFKISASQIFYNSPSGLTAAIVNLRPIVPGHVLVIPTRIVRTLSELTDEEYDDLWRSTRIVQNALEKHYNAGGFNVAVQDGRVAGQSVPHVHVHILPRVEGDLERNDDIYDHLEDWAPSDSISAEKQKNKVELEVPEDVDRQDRTMEMMEDESAIYKGLLGTEANI